MAETENRVAQVRNRFESLKQNPQEPTSEGGGPASNKKGGKIPKTIEPNENRKRERVEKEMEGGKVKVRKKEWEEGKKAQLWGEMLKRAEPEIVNCDCEQSQTDSSKKQQTKLNEHFNVLEIRPERHSDHCDMNIKNLKRNIVFKNKEVQEKKWEG